MKNLRLSLLTTTLLTIGMSGNVMAHDILGGSLGASQNAVDVFRTTCFSWGDGVHPAPIAGDVAGPASGFKYEISLTAGTAVTATVGYTAVGNVNGNVAGNNVLPASPAPLTSTATDTGVSAAWNVNGVSPEFGLNTGSATPGWTAGYLGVGSGLGNGEYVIVVSHANATATKYDFLGHCWKNTTSSGSAAANHTGHGAWFTGTAPNVSPSFDYDQVIDQ